MMRRPDVNRTARDLDEVPGQGKSRPLDGIYSFLLVFRQSQFPARTNVRSSQPRITRLSARFAGTTVSLAIDPSARIKQTGRWCANSIPDLRKHGNPVDPPETGIAAWRCSSYEHERRLSLMRPREGKGPKYRATVRRIPSPRALEARQQV